ncbi:hypothetical protein AB0I28_06035 [Phytomonospora sp. NPDC050363]|uniref:hypothetical protein n=1 Tax=Phytomonospora sp. NPDC050363 TaxID=3155642 RepID=UPI0033CE1CEE
MYQPAPAAPASGERPPSVTRGAAAIGVTCLGLLVSSFTGVLTFTYEPPDSANAAMDDQGAAVFLISYIGWGLLSVVLLMLGAIISLRRINAGRVLIWVVGGISVLTLLSCAGGGVLVEILGSAESGGRDDSYPPQWMFFLAIFSSIVGLVALIMGMVYYGRRESGNWFKPPVAYFPQQGYPQQPYRPY